ncbi:lipocalin family protein [Aquimarina spinulae]|uniref:lipocalin family protein n=1 Tax=Aquimarina spinulae TaxID=1192023 RepID=UPI000D55EDE6|nr:lipocalin family protein [Aquimarina spinulae]
MKKILLVTFVTLLAISCGSKSKDEAIKGKWVASDIEYQMEGADKEMKEFADVMKEALIGKMSFEFKEDKTFVALMPMGKKETKGTWSISEDGKTLTTTDEKKSEDMTIVNLDSSKLALSKKDPQGTSTITFKKE